MPRIRLLLAVGFLSGCMPLLPTKPDKPDTCELTELQRLQLTSVANLRSEQPMSPSLLLGLLEPDGPPWIKPQPQDWSEFRSNTQRWRAQQIELDDSANFLMWIAHKNKVHLQLSDQQVAAHYLAARVGQSAYRQKAPLSETLIRESQQASVRAKQWANRFKACPNLLSEHRSQWWKIWNWRTQ